jgi:hypothetical protein
VEVAREFVETLALERLTVHSEDMSNSDGMSDSGGGPYYWCLRHNRFETDRNVCPASMTMGPHKTPTEAEQALSRVAKHNEQLDAEDAQWHRRAAVATHPDPLTNIRAHDASGTTTQHTA